LQGAFLFTGSHIYCLLLSVWNNKVYYGVYKRTDVKSLEGTRDVCSGRGTMQMTSTQEITEQNRDTLIHILRQEYVRQLEHSLREVAMNSVGLHEYRDDIRSSVQLVLRGSSLTREDPLPSYTSIVQAYDHAGQRLLILGEPGAGKTTLLLDLACELLARAESDSALPIPVIFNLSGWANQKPPLESWLINQLQLVYNIPSPLSLAWLKQDNWLLLFDGLDEIEESLQPACIEAINAYQGEEHSIPLVVCSRPHGSQAQESQLALSHAVIVQPLQERQVIEYFEQLGEPVAAIREAVRSNVTLRKLITTPLMLHVLVLAYRSETVIDLPQLGSPEEQRRQILDRCMRRMLEQQTAGRQFSLQQTRSWLAWLAQQMKQHQLTEFYLEWLQPNWLTTESSQNQYRLFVMLVYGVVGGLLYGVVGALIYGLIGKMLYGLVLGLLLGLVLGLVGGLVDEIKIIRPAEVLTWSWKSVWRGLFAGMSDIKKPRLLESLDWSWNSIWQGVIVGLVVGLLAWLVGYGLIGGLLAGLIGGVVGWLLVGLVGSLLAGLVCGLIGGVIDEVSGEQIDKDMHIRSNQGIHDAGWKALCYGLIGGLLVGLVAGLIGGWMGGQVYGLTVGIFLGVFLGTLIAQLTGGRAYICHYALRYVFYRNGAMPWHYLRFLEEAIEHNLLWRVAGGYRFAHPLFIDCFAPKETNVLSDSMNQALEPLPQP
jgi:hypothetical protein